MHAPYNHIIVGGGTSGCVLAHRLAKETDARILLLEAGRDSGSKEDVLVPGKYMHQLKHDHEGLWKHETTSQPQLDGRSITFLRGKQLGGSSAVNYMAMARGPADDYDQWARTVGDEGWSWDRVLPRMRALEDFDASVPPGFEHLADPESRHHGVGGPIKLGMGKLMTPGVTHFVNACQEIGIGLCPDINSGNPVGVGLAQFNVRDGIRSYAANAYLSEEFRSKHPNLHIQTNVEVRKLLVDGTQVYGVLVHEASSLSERIIRCSEQVILCAGTFASPQILLSSGIGPADELKRVGFSVVHNMPSVGQGMLDHSILTLEFRVKDSETDFCRLFNDEKLLTAAERQYQQDRSGPLSIFGTSGAVAFPKIESLHLSAEFAELPRSTQEFLKHPQRPSAEIWLGSGYAAFQGPIGPNDGFITFELLLQNNLSRGAVSLKPKADGVAFIVDPNFLDHSYDRRIAIESVRQALKIAQASSYKSETLEMVHGPELESDEAILTFVRKNLGQGYHSVGTCKMGLKSDSASVVDRNFDVIGLKGLKMADLSVCPILTSNHTQINAYLIGDKCADVIVDSWKG